MKSVYALPITNYFNCIPYMIFPKTMLVPSFYEKKYFQIVFSKAFMFCDMSPWTLSWTIYVFHFQGSIVEKAWIRWSTSVSYIHSVHSPLRNKCYCDIRKIKSLRVNGKYNIWNYHKFEFLTEVPSFSQIIYRICRAVL